ncbi:MAG: FAD-dependent oxidoreductase [Thermoleophilia bacterium]|jgi:formate dehydrogenase beta subunit|nr:FAD-dependent oxidoreductase [Thermoleophilia bacterium]
MTTAVGTGPWTEDVSALPDELATWFGAVMGWGGVAVFDEAVDLVDLTREFAARLVDECCGQCSPCRIGMHEVAGILDRVCEGRAGEQELERARTLAAHVADAARCDLGRTGAATVLEALERERDAFLAAATAGAPRARGHYASSVVAPCMAACPAGVDIPAYVEQLRIDAVDRSAEAVRRRCPMPATIGRVCVRPCEDACRRGVVDEPIAIRTLKRFVADSEPEARACALPGQARVGIIGAGPAGLACAYYLAFEGIRSTIFEALPEPGGMAAVGIPDYRLPRRVLRAEVARVETLGVEIRYNQRFGVDVTMEELFGHGYEAVFVAVGAHHSARMGCEGEDAGYEGFMPGVEFLREVALGRVPLAGETMLVIGGGNVAMDCVRTARRLGFGDVHLLYRRTEAEMPADRVEIAEAREEGVVFDTLVAPVRIIAEDGRVAGLECRRMKLGEPDSSGRRRPEPVEGSEFVVACDAIVPAIGQVCSVDELVPDTVAVSRWKTVEADPLTMQTADPRVFGGGDCFTGPSSLVAALAAGRRAATSIERFLEGKSPQPTADERLERGMLEVLRSETAEPLPFTGSSAQLHAVVVAPEVRIRCFDEVEGAVSTAEARHEAERCLRCYRIAVGAVREEGR